MLSLADPLPGPPVGQLHIEVFSCGRLLEVFSEQNLVVNGYKDIHARLVGGGGAAYAVTQFGVGVNGAAPQPANTALASPFLKSFDSVSHPAPGQVRYGFSLLSGEANGLAILEFGLLTAGGRLYARRVRSSVLNKTADISFSGTWTITF